ncbi:MAG: hypothetical protein K2N03_06250, partial [Muribaculaceae bacterium]|nr:hypothetical protein [Muribaculaceae bacterium]
AVREDLSAKEAASTGFDNSDIPMGWTTDAKFENRDRYCGVAAPALKVETNGLAFRTPVFNSDIHSVVFTGRVQYDDPYTLDVYGVDENGNNFFISRHDLMTTAMKQHEITLPEGIRSVYLYYTMHSTGQYLFVDDIRINTLDSFKESPVSADNMNYVEPTRALVSGLSPDTEYVAYVTPLKDNAEGKRSKAVAFRLNRLSSDVEDIDAEIPADGFSIVGNTVIPDNAELPYDIFAIDGSVIANSVRGNYTLPTKGVYIVRGSSASVKFII